MTPHSHRLSLLCVVALAATTALARDIQHSAPLGPGGRVSLDNYKGLIRVTTWDRPTVDVQAHIEADGHSPRDRDLVDATEIEFRATASAVDIRTRYPRRQFENVSLPLVRYTIRIPRNAELRIKDYKSDIQLDGLSARLDLETYKGTIELRRHAGELHVKTYKGEARVEFAGYTASSSLETYRGSYNIVMPRDAGFDIRSDVGRRGTLQSTFPILLPAGSTTGEGTTRATVNGGGPTLHLKGYRGNFQIR